MTLKVIGEGEIFDMPYIPVNISMSDVFLQTGLPIGDTILFNCKFRFREELYVLPVIS